MSALHQTTRSEPPISVYLLDANHLPPLRRRSRRLVRRQTFRTRPARSGRLNSRASNPLHPPSYAPPTRHTEGHDKKQSLHKKYSLLARLAFPSELLPTRCVTFRLPEYFTYGGSASSKPRVLFALSSRDRVFHEKPCAVLNEARQKTLADVVRRPQMRYQHSGFSQKIGAFSTIGY